MSLSYRLILSSIACFTTCCVSIQTYAKHVTTQEASERVTASLKIGTRTFYGYWYIPKGEAKAWIMLQHGFMRNSNNLTDLASYLQQNNIAVLTLNLNKDHMNSKAFAQETAKALMRIQPPKTYTLPEKFLVAGHSLGGLFAMNVAASLVNLSAQNFYGAILLDPVEKNNQMKEAQSLLNEKTTVLSILAEPGQCNSSSNATPILRKFSYPFVGVRLTQGSHCDAEGASTNWMCTMMCGTSHQRNIDLLKELVKDWSYSLIDTQYKSRYMPNSEEYEKLLLQKAISPIRN